MSTYEIQDLRIIYRICLFNYVNVSGLVNWIARYQRLLQLFDQKLYKCTARYFMAKFKSLPSVLISPRLPTLGHIFPTMPHHPRVISCGNLEYKHMTCSMGTFAFDSSISVCTQSVKDACSQL